MPEVEVKERLAVSENHPLYKWKKAQLLVELGRVKIDYPSEERTQIKVEGFNDTYILGVDIKPGRTKCSCPTEHYSRDNEYVECAHSLAAQIFLSQLPEEQIKELY